MKSIIILSLVALSFFGCSSKNYGYKNVYVPIKCEAHVPQRPQNKDDTFEYLKNILIYTEQLEIIIKGCVNPK